MGKIACHSGRDYATSVGDFAHAVTSIGLTRPRGQRAATFVHKMGRHGVGALPTLRSPHQPRESRARKAVEIGGSIDVPQARRLAPRKTEPAEAAARFRHHG